MRKTYKILLISALFILVTATCFYVFIVKTDRLPYKNYSDFSTGSGYIYSKVTYRDSVYLIVMPNSDFYECIEDESNHEILKISYITKLSFTNFFEIPIRIDKEKYENLKYYIVESRLISKYFDIDLTSNRHLNGDIFQDSIKWQDRKALTYLLLNTKTRNCSNDCETGEIVISEP